MAYSKFDSGGKRARGFGVEKGRFRGFSRGGAGGGGGPRGGGRGYLEMDFSV